MPAAGVVLLNAQAGDGRALALRRPIEDWLAHATPGVPVLVPSGLDEAHAMLSILAARSRVVLVGGDGTLQRLLPAILAQGHRIGLVAAGQRNGLAHRLALADRPLADVLATALLAPAQPIGLMQVDTEGQVHHVASQLRCERLVDAGPSRASGRSTTWAALGSTPAAPLRLWADGRLVHEGAAQRLIVAPSTPDENQPATHAALTSRLYSIESGDPGEGDRPRPRSPGWVSLLAPILAMLRQRSTPARAARPALIPNSDRLLADTDLDHPWSLALDGEPIEPVARWTVQWLPRALPIALRQVARPGPEQSLA